MSSISAAGTRRVPAPFAMTFGLTIRRTVYLAGMLGVALALRWTDSRTWIGAAGVEHGALTLSTLALVLALVGAGVIKLILDDRSQQRTYRATMLARLGQTQADVLRIRGLLVVPTSTEERSRLLGELVRVRQELDMVYDLLPACAPGRRVVGIFECTEALRRQLRDVMDRAVVSRADRLR
jgi:hypothetical protein